MTAHAAKKDDSQYRMKTPQPIKSEKEFRRLAEKIREIPCRIIGDLSHVRITPAEAKKRRKTADDNLKKMRHAIKDPKTKRLSKR